LWRDAKLLEIGGGTNEAHQKNITKDLSRLDYNVLLDLLSGNRN
jgi:isovaleryl-CoA dehydrogenase